MTLLYLLAGRTIVKYNQEQNDEISRGCNRSR